MTFLLDSSMDEDNPLNVVASSSEETEEARGEKSKPSDMAMGEDDEEMEQFKRQRELTDKYIAG